MDLFRFGQPRTAHVWKIRATGGEPVQVTRNNGTAAVEAPDGKTIYYAGPTVINTAIWKMPASGGLEEFVVGEVLTAHNFDVFDDGLYFSSLTETDGSSIRFYRFATAADRVDPPDRCPLA